MAVYYSTELAGLYSTPAVKPNGASGYAAKLRRYRATITLATQTTSDYFIIGQIPSGEDFAYGVLTSTVSLGSSTISIGTSGTTNKYRNAATFTVTDTPTMFGNTAQVAALALTAEEQIILSISTASLPGSGTLVVDLYFSRP